MSCLTELTGMTYADGELPGEEARAVERHLAGCGRCRTLVAALAEESRALAAALAEPAGARAARPAAGRGTPAAAEGPGGRVAGAGWARWGRAAAALGAAGGVALAGPGLWGGAAGPAGEGVDWWGWPLETLLWLVRHGADLGRAATLLALLTMGALALAGGALLLGRRAPGRLALLGAAAALLAAWPSPARALEARAGGRIAVPAGETVAGTLLASGDTVEVAGEVAGDLVAAARWVEVRGRVAGNLVVAARDVIVDGEVGGSVYAAAGTLTVRGAVGGAVLAAARVTRVEPGGRVGGDLAVVGRTLALAGSVGRDAWFLGASGWVRGALGRDLVARADRLDVAPPAAVGRDLRATVGRPDESRVDPAVPVGGARAVEAARRRGAGPLGRWHAWGVFWAATSFVGAVACGVVAWRLAPGFFRAAVDAVPRWRRSLGVGALVLVLAPPAILLTGLTLVGLPLALAALALYLAGLYGATVVAGAWLGRRLLRPRDEGLRGTLGALAVGLGVLTLALRVPVLGWVLRVAVLCAGLGALAGEAARRVRAARA
jgi:hypothetical protein